MFTQQAESHASQSKALAGIYELRERATSGYVIPVLDHACYNAICNPQSLLWELNATLRKQSPQDTLYSAALLYNLETKTAEMEIELSCGSPRSYKTLFDMWLNRASGQHFDLDIILAIENSKSGPGGGERILKAA